MARLYKIFLVTLVLAQCAAMAGVVTPGPIMRTIGSAAPTYLITEGWEGDNSGSWSISQTASAVNMDNTTNVLEGAQSLAVVGTDNANYAYNTTLYAATDDARAYFTFVLTAGPTVDDYTRSAMWLVDSANNHLLTLEVYRLSSGTFKFTVSNGTSTGVRTVATFALGTTNAVWVRYVKGSGANSTSEVWFDDYGDGVATKPADASNNYAIQTGDSTASNQRIQLGAGTSGGQGTSTLYDHVRVIGATIGSDPP